MRATAAAEKQSVGDRGDGTSGPRARVGKRCGRSPHLRPHQRARSRHFPRRRWPQVPTPPVLRRPRRHPSQGTSAWDTKGSLQDFISLLEAVRQVDTVICAVPSSQALEQKLLLRAIKEAGCIKRFLPSEFGADPDKVQILDMAYGFYENKAEIRRCIEKEGIPYTYISCNFLMRYLLPSLLQPGLSSPPRDKIKIFGHGDVKAVFVKESDVASFTICAMDDPRTLNKVLYLRPPGNVCSQNQIVESWEVKTGKKLAKVYVTEEQLLKNIQETPFPNNMDLIFIYSTLIKGDHTYFNIDSSGLDGNKLYPHLKYTTVDEYLDSLARDQSAI